MRVSTTNILSGGGDRYKVLCDHIVETGSDYHIITEFRPASSKSLELAQRLRNFDYNVSFAPAKPQQNAVAIASKSLIRAKQFGTFSENRILLTGIGELDIVGLYAPQPKDDRLFHSKLISYLLTLDKPTIIIGDWNAGLHFIDENAKTFTRHKEILRLHENNWCECWRMFNNPRSEEYSWYHKTTHNGFRIDQAFIQKKYSHMISSAYFDHQLRESKGTDHSTMVVDLNCNSQLPVT